MDPTTSFRLSCFERFSSRGRWWRSPDWWLRTTASAAVGRIVGAVLTGIGLVLAWAVARALGVL
jgi:hypothetical protein